jgi:hypothetical protein
MTNQPEHSSDLPQAVVDALWRGNRSEAIELLQRVRHIEREEARELVATYILFNSAVQRRMDDGQPKLSWGIMPWLILFQAILVAIGYFLFFHDKW